MPSKTYRALAAGLVLIGVVIAAVIQLRSNDGTPTELAEPVPSTEPQAPTSTASDTGFVYRVGLLAGVTTTNYWEYMGTEPTAWNAYVLGPTKAALFAIDPATNTLVPELAAEAADPIWDSNGWRVHLELSDDLSWSDGNPVTAGDVAYTFDTVRRLHLGGGWADSYPEAIEDIVSVTDTELRVEFTSRPSLGLWPYGVGLAPIMPAHVWSELSEPASSAKELYAVDDPGVSGGPLQIVDVGSDRIEAVANEGYPRNTASSVVYTIFPNEEAAVAAVSSGAIDTILDPNGLSAEGVSTLSDSEDVAIERSPANSVRYLGFNLTRDPMSEPAFRRSLALLLDRGSVTEALAPEADTAYTMLSSANVSWFDAERADKISAPYTKELNQRVNAAVTALEQAGYTWETRPTVVDGAMTPGTGLAIDGRPPAPLTILTPGDEYDPARPDYTARIESTLETLGFDVRPVVTDFDTVVDLAFTEDESGARQYDMYVLGWTLGSPALPDYHRWLFATDAAANSTGYSTSDFDHDLAAYRQATAPEEAKTALWAMEGAIARDLPYLVLYHPEIVEAYRSDRVRFGEQGVLGGIQGRLGGLDDLRPTS
jgi:peptide/nickel transport system substrate-binding protein